MIMAYMQNIRISIIGIVPYITPDYLSLANYYETAI